MNRKVNGELVPQGGGDPIPLIREILTVGRRESCDIRLAFQDISGLHCQLYFRNGYWYVRDLNSTNGVKVNGTRVQEKVLHPRDELSIGRKRKYLIEYDMPTGQSALEEAEEDILGQSLMEKAGLEKPRRDKGRRPASRDAADFLLADDDD